MRTTQALQVSMDRQRLLHYTWGMVGAYVALAPAALAHAVHVEVSGLQPGRDYVYQLHVRDEESPVGHFHTALPAHEMVHRLHCAFATCQDWSSGFDIAYRDMLQYDLDVVFHLGDYTYAYAIDATRRSLPAPTGFAHACLDLRTSRLRHTLYKLDPDPQTVHAQCPFVVIWDTHDVADDDAGLSGLSVDLEARCAATPCCPGAPSGERHTRLPDGSPTRLSPHRRHAS